MILFQLSPTLTSPIPWWFLLSCCLGTVYYQTMDGLDGKQARRTGTSSALGELFDHGLDALNCGVGTLTMVGAFQMGVGIRAMVAFATCVVPFYIATWEEYYTGTMNLGYVNGPSEGLFAIQIMYLAEAAFGLGTGGEWLHMRRLIDLHPVFAAYGVPAWATMMDLVLALTGLVVLWTVASAVASVMGRISTTGSACPRKSGYQAVLDLFSFAALCGGFCYWGLTAPALVRSHPYMFYLTFGVLFARLAGRVIVARLLQSAVSHFDMALIPLAMALVNLRLALVPQLVMLSGVALYAAVTYTFITWTVISDIKHYLHIRCLHIPSKKD